MEYTPEAERAVRRIAKETLQWSPTDLQVQRVITLSVTDAYFAAVLGRVYRSRFATPVAV